ncbi:iron complex transport system permease protein [Sphingobacterium allocomposti]|uniref:Iron complex transport system permease protein n=1 Tax=Sphingobacterium allocomposti TaxID=415956 RepID=A0A5S5DS43_9SPHI|nr:iron ABC transporter permease [Sphingobacterium composti Yoo et al. 2007 non Ten et al. 2007]TYP97682.1 iron complex transport system permease protein [Sphingobacterium composti Yoo et al. 2007 non Ten et al. 2007]
MVLTSTLLAVALLSLSLGAYYIAIDDVWRLILEKIGMATSDSLDGDVLFVVRTPRVLLGLLVGAALGGAGAAVQGIFRNPLADPGLIGISAGASLFAVLVIAFESILFVGLSQLFGHYLLILGSFVGAGLTAFMVYRLSLKEGRPQVTTMLLAGIAINGLAGALTGLTTYMATEQQLRTITFWMLGSLGGATWESVAAVTPFIILPVFGMLFFGKALNAFALGETQADLLGMRTDNVKLWVVTLGTLAVGAAVAVSGIIGFVGLLVPHTVRLMGGADNRYVLVASIIMGSMVLTLADVLCRTLAAPIELPIGVITALLGTPVFLYILIKER